MYWYDHQNVITNEYCYIASAKTKRDWPIHGHVALDKCNVSLGQQVSNCCPAAYINKQNGGESCKFENSDFRAFCLKKCTIDREDMLLKLKFNYSSKFWLLLTCKCLVYAIKFSIYCHVVKYNYRKSDFSFLAI